MRLTIACLLLSFPAHARLDCDMAPFIEAAEQTHDKERKARQWAAWIQVATPQGRAGTVIRARSAHESGLKARQVYEACSY